MEPQKRRNYKKRKRLLALFSLFMGVVFLCTGCRAAEMAEGALSRLYRNLMEELSLEKPGQENQGNGKNSWESQSLEIGKYPIPQEWEENTFSTFFQLMYERPDLEDLQEQMWALLDDIAQQSRSPQELLEETERIIQLYDEAYTQYVLADLRYSLDITDAFFASEVSFLPEDMGKCQQLLNQILAALFSDASLAEQAESRWGEERAVFLQRQGETGEDSQRLVELLEREQEILYEYDQLLIHTSVAYQGQEWTEWELYQDTSLTLEEYQEAYALLLEDLGESAGELFCQLVAVRQEMAKEEGYDSYAEYAYQETYFRDYSPREAKLLQEYVKRYVVPLYGELWLDWYDGDSQRLYEQTYDSEECLQALLEVADSLSPEFAQAGKLLRQGQLYDLSASEGKLNQSFTVYLDSYQVPFLFSKWTGGYLAPTSLIHEFGHFYQYTVQPGHVVYYPDPYDVSEIDSQALELLLMPYYDAFYGELAPAACREKLLDGMNSLIMGCMEDEFQQRIYERAEPWTPQELHDLYSQLQQEYGIDALYLVFEGEWVTIRHTFESPFYYISYAVSQVPALCLWQESLTDHQEAMEKYDRIIHRNPYDTFSGILEKETLPSPFEEETIKELCLLLEQQGGEYIFGSDEAA